ncbi:hypothetical protein NCZ76_24660, partial [Bacteroides thetaiotaomicron]|nr:hypothetical protein [Bacteroides thetaiotaomicron]
MIEYNVNHIPYWVGLTYVIVNGITKNEEIIPATFIDNESMTFFITFLLRDPLLEYLALIDDDIYEN